MIPRAPASTGRVDAPTEVCISVDTEFSIAGHITFPDRYQPVGLRAVECPADGTEHGLGFMLDTLAAFGCRATFFVETLNESWFGDAPMQGVVERLLGAGQDVQLHVHPEWLRLLPPPGNESFAANGWCDGRSAEELHRVLSRAMEIFERWVGRKPDALRTGSLRTDLQVYRTSRELGIPLSSNVGLSTFRPAEADLVLRNGRHAIEGVMEIPVFTYTDLVLPGFRRDKSLQISSCGAREMKRVLKGARAAGAASVVILTHPFEFAKRSDFQYSRIRRNRVNQNRLRSLLRFIEAHPHDFVATTFADSSERWLTSDPEPEIDLVIPSAYAIGRMLHNKINDLVWAW